MEELLTLNHKCFTKNLDYQTVWESANLHRVDYPLIKVLQDKFKETSFEHLKLENLKSGLKIFQEMNLSS